MRHSKTEKVREVITSLAVTHSLVVEQMEELIVLLQEIVDLEDNTPSLPIRTVKSNRRPIANRQTLSIEWDGKSCFLGNTLLFLFFERLSRSANRYVSHEELLDDVWGGDREATTIRGVVKRLRDKLEDSEMTEVAHFIDGSIAGYYGLILV